MQYSGGELSLFLFTLLLFVMTSRFTSLIYTTARIHFISSMSDSWSFSNSIDFLTPTKI